MVNKKVSNERSLTWCMVLYPDEDVTHKKALEYIENNYNYAYIVHDKDLTESGELKKKHTHLVIKFKNYRWRNSIAEELQITPNYLEKCRNLEKALKYLIHFDNEDKIQYNVSNVHGQLKRKLEEYLQDRDISESDKVLQLIQFIREYDQKLSITDFVEFCCTNNLFDVYRRSQYSWNKIIEEHNFKIWEKDQYKY